MAFHLFILNDLLPRISWKYRPFCLAYSLSSSTLSPTLPRTNQVPSNESKGTSLNLLYVLIDPSDLFVEVNSFSCLSGINFNISFEKFNIVSFNLYDLFNTNTLPGKYKKLLTLAPFHSYIAWSSSPAK